MAHVDWVRALSVQWHVTSLEITPSTYFLAYTGQENLSPKATRLAVYIF